LQHPELLHPAGGEETVVSRQKINDLVTCAERIRLGEQSLNVNSRVAVEMAEMLAELLLTQTLKRFATYFDLESGASCSIYNTPEAISAAIKYKPKGKSRNRRK
jgi:hypothetical protein